MNTPFGSETDILELVEGFQDRTLPKEQWTHHAHLVTAIWYHVNYSPYEAICYLRSGIATYNVATGGKNTHQDGYHETLTLFWCHAVAAFVASNKNLTLVELCQKFLQSEMASKEYPFRFYTKEALMSLRARAVWVEKGELGIGE